MNGPILAAAFVCVAGLTTAIAIRLAPAKEVRLGRTGVAVGTTIRVIVLGFGVVLAVGIVAGLTGLDLSATPAQEIIFAVILLTVTAFPALAVTVRIHNHQEGRPISAGAALALGVGAGFLSGCIVMQTAEVLLAGKSLAPTATAFWWGAASATAVLLLLASITAGLIWAVRTAEKTRALTIPAEHR